MSITDELENTADTTGAPKLQPSTETEVLKFTYEDAILGTEIHNYSGARILEHTTSKGDVLALKVNTPKGVDRAEGEMANYAAANGILAPKCRGVYDIYGHRKRPIARVMVSERVPGVPLADVWRDLSKSDQSSIKDQLREQIRLMRACTQPFIGRPGHRPTRNIYDGYFTSYCGPFDDEEAFEEWCIGRLPVSLFESLSKWKWQRVFKRRRKDSGGKTSFVLSHCDLSPRNIMVQGSTVTGIVDWEHSGFFPDYVEYAFAMGLGPGLEEWWKPVLREILQPCSKDLVKFTSLVEEDPSRIPPETPDSPSLA